MLDMDDNTNVLREVDWGEVRRYAHAKIESNLKELRGCPLDKVERIRGRIEAYEALVQLERTPPGQ